MTTFFTQLHAVEILDAFSSSPQLIIRSATKWDPTSQTTLRPARFSPLPSTTRQPPQPQPPASKPVSGTSGLSWTRSCSHSQDTFKNASPTVTGPAHTGRRLLTALGIRSAPGVHLLASAGPLLLCALGWLGALPPQASHEHTLRPPSGLPPPLADSSQTSDFCHGCFPWGPRNPCLKARSLNSAGFGRPLIISSLSSGQHSRPPSAREETGVRRSEGTRRGHGAGNKPLSLEEQEAQFTSD